MENKTSRLSNIGAVLLLSYWFPPFAITSKRSFFIFKELKKTTRNIKVISTSNLNVFIKNKNTHTIPELETAFTIDHRSLRLWKNNEKFTTSEKKKNSFNFKLYHFINSFPFNILMGEGGLLYIFNSYILGKRFLKKNRNTLLVSSFRPYSDHVVAYLLKKKFPQSIWVADFRDLHIDPVLKETFFPRFQKWCNKKILSRADVATTVSEGLAAHLRPLHPNVVVLRNGIGGLPYAAGNIAAPNKFTICYTGSMFRDLRRPDMLLEALTELFLEKKIERQKTQIIYAGKDTATWESLIGKYYLKDIFQTYGSVPHVQSLQLQRSSHINLLLTYSSPELRGNVTGKLYEYLASGRPILLLVNGDRDEELEKIFTETNAGLVACEKSKDTDTVKNFVLEKYNEWTSTGKVISTINNSAVEKYKWPNMMQDFLEKHILEKKNEPAAI